MSPFTEWLAKGWLSLPAALTAAYLHNGAPFAMVYPKPRPWVLHEQLLDHSRCSCSPVPEKNRLLYFLFGSYESVVGFSIVAGPMPSVP
jgi:hypothetical protein